MGEKIMSNKEYDQFYDKLKTFLNATSSDLSPSERSIVTFRVALEDACEGMGVNGGVYMMSRLLSLTLGIVAGDEAANIEEVMEGFDYETMH
jgi:hypothetical protein|tara:strand:+ start:1475 stop:1750 length:276 start_codon:yes stop_codon:yes gene_type:complete